MPRVYTNKDCPLHGSDYCARLNMESCDTCTVRGRNEEEMQLLRDDLDAIAALMPEEGLSELFLTDECVLCKGEEKGARTWYAQTDIGNAQPKRKRTTFLGIKREASAGSILPVQLACCDACRKRYLMLQYVAPVTAAACMTLGLVLMSIRPIREPLMAVMPSLPVIVFLALTLAGVLGGWLWRKALYKRYEEKTEFSIFRIETLQRMRRLGWFELYDGKDLSRLVFSKKRLRQGLYTGGEPSSAADMPSISAGCEEE